MIHRWGPIAGAALLIAGTGAKAADRIFSLAITGETAARYAGRCTVTTEAGDETLELSGVVPRHEELTGHGLVCRFESTGLISVEITHDGNVSRAVTNGGSVSVAVR